MRVLVATLALLALAQPAFADTRTVELEPFHAIEASGSYRVNVRTGAGPSLTVSGSASDLEQARVRVVNGVLQISERCTFFCAEGCMVLCSRDGPRAVIEVVAPRLDRIEASRGVEMTADKVASEVLAAEARMGGILNLAGSCQRLAATASMGGVLSAKEMRCQSVDVRSSMGGVAGVYADADVRARASVGGMIEVRGEPEQRDVSSSVGSTISME